MVIGTEYIMHSVIIFELENSNCSSIYAISAFNFCQFLTIQECFLLGTEGPVCSGHHWGQENGRVK